MTSVQNLQNRKGVGPGGLGTYFNLFFCSKYAYIAAQYLVKFVSFYKFKVHTFFYDNAALHTILRILLYTV
jgi:hypothetical protein